MKTPRKSKEPKPSLPREYYWRCFYCVRLQVREEPKAKFTLIQQENWIVTHSLDCKTAIQKIEDEAKLRFENMERVQVFSIRRITARKFEALNAEADRKMRKSPDAKTKEPEPALL